MITDKLPLFKARLSEIDSSLSDPQIMKDMNAYKALMQERSRLVPVVEEIEKLQNLQTELEENIELSKDGDESIAQMAKEEIQRIQEEIPLCENRCKVLLIPPDPLEGKNIIMEIRAGTGGEEAALFVSDLLRMYAYYAQSKHWSVSEISSNPTELGGYKEVILSISGKEVYGNLRWESGVHRVQRVPET
ncbi:MAG: PCRF domain-containing protein, partial [Spirochaetales bacterium]